MVCVGLDKRYEGEQPDEGNRDVVRESDKSSLALPKSQLRLLKAVIATGVDVIVVNMTGSAIDMKWLDETSNVRAILQSWYPGGEGGLAVARVLFGEANPSGKLPITFYQSTAELPPVTDYAMKGRTYRYMETPALYPFGYGLSYTKYEYSELAVSVDGSAPSGTTGTDSRMGDGAGEKRTVLGSAAVITVTVENTGSMDGEEIVQLYIKDLESEYEVRNHRLAAFVRVALKAGEKKTVTLRLAGKALQIVDNDGIRRKDGNRFMIWVGGSQPDGRSVELLGQRPLCCEVIC